jgi:hypothetical protein
MIMLFQKWDFHRRGAKDAEKGPLSDLCGSAVSLIAFQHPQ